MSDTFATSTPVTRSGRRRNAEFLVYFGLIFLAALPFACVKFARSVILRRTLNLRGPLAIAWAEADRVTPLIFSA